MVQIVSKAQEIIMAKMRKLQSDITEMVADIQNSIEALNNRITI